MFDSRMGWPSQSLKMPQYRAGWMIWLAGLRTIEAKSASCIMRTPPCSVRIIKTNDYQARLEGTLEPHEVDAVAGNVGVVFAANNLAHLPGVEGAAEPRNALERKERHVGTKHLLCEKVDTALGEKAANIRSVAITRLHMGGNVRKHGLCGHDGAAPDNNVAPRENLRGIRADSVNATSNGTSTPNSCMFEGRKTTTKSNLGAELPRSCQKFEDESSEYGCSHVGATHQERPTRDRHFQHQQ
jgi:hypothetical protein